MSKAWNKAHPEVLKAASQKYYQTDKGKANNRKWANDYYQRARVAAKLSGLPYNQFRYLPLSERQAFLKQAQEAKG